MPAHHERDVVGLTREKTFDILARARGGRDSYLANGAFLSILKHARQLLPNNR